MTLAERFEAFATWCEGTSPLYERLARGVAGDPDLLDLAGTVPEGRSPPHVLLASVHSLLLAGREHPLADFYASVTDEPTDPTAEDPLPAFRAFCLDEEAALRELLSTRRTQTNSVRRCAALYPAFARVSEAVSGDLSLIEVGPSAGLNLLWDRYAYEYDRQTGGAPDGPTSAGPADAARDGHDGTIRVGREDATVVVESSVGEGDPPLPDDPPPVASRVGVDLNPLDVRDPADARWLRALTWPEHESRRRLLDDAIEEARTDPPEIREGDALAVLPELLAAAEDPVVVYNTQTLYQFGEDERERFRTLLVEHGADRELHWLSGEHGVESDEPEIWLQWATVTGGRLVPEQLLAYEQHGRWIRWVGGA